MEKISEKTEKDYLLDDAAIKKLEDDTLGRANFAKELGKSILNIKAANGFVYGLEGEWGSGKTSILNMTVDYLEENKSDENPIIIIRFNPWWFSGQNQLIKQFFKEFTYKLQNSSNDSLKNISKSLNIFSKIVAPLQYIPVYGIAAKMISDGASSIADGVSEMAEKKEENIQSIRDEIDNAIRNQDARFLIIIDDIDRLTSEEIRQLFRVVKAIANFPKTIYLLSYDEEVVIKALKDVQNCDGKKYLEKFIQTSIDVPLINKFKLEDRFFRLLENIIDEKNNLFDEKLWGHIYNKGIKHFLTSIRDVNRLINRLQVTYPLVKNEVNPVDFIALQTFKIFQPEVYKFIKENKNMFTGDNEYNSSSNEFEREKSQETAEKFLKTISDDYRFCVKTMLGYLSNKWLSIFNGNTYGTEWLSEYKKECRLQSPDIFNRYFRFELIEDEISRLELENIILKPNNKEFYKKTFEKYANINLYDSSSKLRILLEHIQDYINSKKILSNIEPMVSVIFDVGDKYLFDKDQISFLSTDNAYRFCEIIEKLLLNLKNQEDRFNILKQSFEQGNTVYLSSSYVVNLGREHGKYTEKTLEVPEGKELITLPQQEILEKICLNKIRKAAKNNKLLLIPKLADLLWIWDRFAKNNTEPKKYVKGLVESDQSLCDYIDQYVMVQRSARIDLKTNFGKEKIRYTINFTSLNYYLPVNLEELSDRCKKILNDKPIWLTSFRKTALETLIKETPVYLNQSTKNVK